MAFQNLFLIYFITFIIGICANSQNDSTTEYNQPTVENTNLDETNNNFYAHLEPRIINGSRALPGQFPYQVSLTVHNQHICGGSVLNDSFIITAAHCMFTKKKHLLSSAVLKVRAGDINLKSHNMKTFKVKRYWVHEHYDPNIIDKGFDIALIHLSEKIGLHTPGRSYIDKISLASKIYPGGELCVVSGWGLIQQYPNVATNLLMYTRVNIVSKIKCRALYPGIRLPDNVCALNPYSDACMGDSGGPLVCSNKGVPELVGIVSWGSGCYSKVHPGVYTDVYLYRDWIRSPKNAASNLITLNYLLMLLIISVSVILK